MSRYRFGPFIVSPRRRLLLRDGRESPLIPRYFDLLVFLIERRHEAVHRRDIFDGVWRDVIVSDSALSQAIRTIRRTLEDDPREPRFIRTVSRHGYRFVFAEVIEEPDEDAVPAPAAAPAGVSPEEVPEAGSTTSQASDSDADRFEPLLDRVTRRAADASEEEDAREAAELLHALGTAEALRRLGTRHGHEVARARLRDTRWDVPGAGDVPIAGGAAPLETAAALVRLRLRRAARISAERWASASFGGGAAGLAAGVIGGLLLAAAPDSTAPVALAAVLGLVGAASGAAGGAGVGAGLAVAEAVARSRRTMGLIAGGAAGGALAGLAAQLLGRWTLAALVGLNVPVGGAIEGLAIGGAAGAAYAAFTRRSDGGLAAPRGADRLRVVAAMGAACALAALLVALSGRPLVGGTIHRIALASEGAQAVLTPLARLVGEGSFGPLSGALVGTGEGGVFGIGLALAITRRPWRAE